MPPRYAYWTIIFGGQPTSFRAAHADDLLPTLKQLQSRHPDAVMKFFARGKLWDSEQAARDALFRKRATRPDGRREGRGARGAEGGGRREARGARGPERGGRGEDRGPARGRDWRPGGQHKDPRDRFKVPRDVKRTRMARKFGWKKKDDDK